ncbi:MAG TPA: hypothetical protein VLH84_02960 [Patescibacteria group bacterium]|nr:hypothetical protein [Patescibacteria group bacterium]
MSHPEYPNGDPEPDSEFLNEPGDDFDTTYVPLTTEEMAAARARHPTASRENVPEPWDVAQVLGL